MVRTVRSFDVIASSVQRARNRMRNQLFSANVYLVTKLLVINLPYIYIFFYYFARRKNLRVIAKFRRETGLAINFPQRKREVCTD